MVEDKSKIQFRGVALKVQCENAPFTLAFSLTALLPWKRFGNHSGQKPETRFSQTPSPTHGDRNGAKAPVVKYDTAWINLQAMKESPMTVITMMSGGGNGFVALNKEGATSNQGRRKPSVAGITTAYCQW